MRIVALLLLISITQTFALDTYGQNKRLNLNVKNETIVKILEEIEDQSEFYFMFDASKIDVTQRKSIDCENLTITSILDQLLENSGIIYHISDRQIGLISTEFVDAQQRVTVSGSVTDQSGSPLPGVTVVVKGTTQGTITDADGNYSLPNVPDDATLIFSFVGMATQEISVSGKSSINVTMAEDAIGIEEVVAIGYGTQKRLAVTGSIVSAKGEDLVKSPSQNLASSLTGRLPGVIINNRSGQPGNDDPTIYIRGKSTTGNANPLIIIDGVERDGLSRLNPNDIENITVLKDASAAIYGARAANGVILVTTKRGSIGKPQFEINLNQGFTQPTRMLKMADSYTYASVYNEYRAAQGLSPLYTNEELQKYKDGSDPDNYPNTNWQELMNRDFSPTQRVNISATGGSKKFKYLVSLGGLNQEGQYDHGTENYRQYNLRSNLDVQVTDYFKFAFDLSGRLGERHTPYGFKSYASSFSHLMLYLPTWTMYWPGTKYLRALRGNGNILNMISDRRGYHNYDNKELTSTLSFKLDIPWIKGLSLDGSANYDTGNNFIKDFFIPTKTYRYDAVNEKYIELYSSGENSTLNETFNQNTALTLNTKINYNGSFKKHNIAVMVGYEQRQTSYDYLNAARINYISSALAELFAGSTNKDDQSNTGTSFKTARQNVFGRISYDFAGKYLAQALFRYDGSQNFAKGNRFGFFPGFSLGWRLSEEPFMNDLDFINNLKIRGSYGEMGNDKVSSYQYLSSYTYSNDYNYVLGGTDVSGLVQNNVPNPDITWEVAKTSNLGLEASLWENLLGVELDVFKTERSNILTKSSAVVPDYTGLSLPDENVGIVENKGFELQLSHSNNKRLLKYNLTGNFSFARNKVIFAEEQAGVEEYQLAIGHPMNTSLFYKATGEIYKDEAQVNNTVHLAGAQPGDLILVDVNDDGEINSLDRIRHDYTNVPEIVYSFNISLSYKDFDLSVLLQGQENASFTQAGWLGRLNPGGGNFPAYRAVGRWTPENTDATMPRNDYGGNNQRIDATFWLLDAGFLRLKNLEFGYNLPRQLTERLNVQNLRVYINGFNLLYLYDHLKDWGIDPEANNNLWYYSQQRVFNLGLNLTF